MPRRTKIAYDCRQPADKSVSLVSAFTYFIIWGNIWKSTHPEYFYAKMWRGTCKKFGKQVIFQTNSHYVRPTWRVEFMAIFGSNHIPCSWECAAETWWASSCPWSNTNFAREPWHFSFGFPSHYLNMKKERKNAKQNFSSPNALWLLRTRKWELQLLSSGSRTFLSLCTEMDHVASTVGNFWFPASSVFFSLMHFQTNLWEENWWRSYSVCLSAPFFPICFNIYLLFLFL